MGNVPPNHIPKQKTERRCMQCPVTMYLNPEQTDHKDFCSITCWTRFYADPLWIPCRLCRTEFKHTKGYVPYCSSLCYRLSLYKVFFPNSIEDNVKPPRKNWVAYCMASNPTYKTPEDVPQFVW